MQLPSYNYHINNIYKKLMFENQSFSNHHSSSTPNKSNHRNKQVKKQNIRKNKNENGKKNMTNQLDSMPRDKLTREQKQELQKQKNRIAAQLSRDKQKQYIQDLQSKIQKLESQMEKRLCRKCMASLSGSSTDQQMYDSQRIDQPNLNLEEQEVLILDSSPQIFYRDQSLMSINSIGKFLFICMIVVGIFSLSTSMQSQDQNMIGGRLMQEIVPYEKSCYTSMKSGNLLFNKKQLNQKDDRNFALKNIQYGINNNIFRSEDKCKNEFIQNYFDSAPLSDYRHKNLNSVATERDRLMNCVKPQLIMRNKQDKETSFFQGLFTLVLDDPEILEVSEKNGDLSLLNVVPLKGLYEIEVQFMNIKKIVGQNCLS